MQCKEKNERLNGDTEGDGYFHPKQLCLKELLPVVIRRQTGIYVGEQLLIKVKCEINSECRTE